MQPECSPETPFACGAVGCISSDDCSPMTPCAEGSCTAEGSCIFSPREDGCREGEYCDSLRGCLLSASTPGAVGDGGVVSDGGARDAGLVNDAGGTGDTGVGSDSATGPMDAGRDASLPPNCGEPCNTGRVCEVGEIDCSTGAAECVAVGVVDAGVVCRPAAGDCDVAERCDGVSSDCPNNGFMAGGTVCGEVIRGAWGACGGFLGSCDGAQSRSVMTPRCSNDMCTVVTTSENRTCSVANGTSCGTPSTGPWSACSFVGCALSGTRTREQTVGICQGGVCGVSTSTVSGSCSRSTSQGSSCGVPSFGPWDICFHPAGCDPAVDATRSRTSTIPTCNAANSCVSNNTVQTEVCPLVDAESTDGGESCDCNGPFDCAL